MGCTLNDSKKEARKNRASFNFVLYRNKQDIWAPKCHLLGEPKPLCGKNNLFNNS